MKSITRPRLIELYESLKDAKMSRPIVIYGLELTGKYSIIKEIYDNRLFRIDQKPVASFNPIEKFEYIDVFVYTAGRHKRLTEEDVKYFQFLAENICPHKPLVWLINSTANPELSSDIMSLADVYDYQLMCTDWIEYAKSKNMSPIIIDFLEKHNEYVIMTETNRFGEKYKCCLGDVWFDVDRTLKGALIQEKKYGDHWLIEKVHSLGSDENNLPLLYMMAMSDVLPSRNVWSKVEIIKSFSEMYELEVYLNPILTQIK